jgi:predicted helicase
MRKHLRQDFDRLYIVDLGGDVRSDTRLSGTRDNVFGIQLGVSISLLVRNPRVTGKEILYAEVGEHWKKEQKNEFLDRATRLSAMTWQTIHPSPRNSWLIGANDSEFASLLPMSRDGGEKSLFGLVSNGVKTNRDDWAFNFDKGALAANMKTTIDFYNDHVLKYRRNKPKSTDDFVNYDDKRISWSRDLKQDLERGALAEFEPDKVRRALYRPFTNSYLFFDRVFNEEIYQLEHVFPPNSENSAIIVTAHSQIPFSVQTTTSMPCVDVGGRPSQLFPFYTYAKDGTHRRENITDWALEQFRSHYADSSVTKWDIFHYVYAILHHPDYREHYAANLRRELPRIPFVGTGESLGDDEPPPAADSSPGGATDISPGRKSGVSQKKDPSSLPKAVAAERSSEAIETFRAFAAAGRRLTEIHVHYEQQPEYPLTKREKPGEKLDYRVTKMKLSKDKTTLTYNQFLTLTDIPKETFEYRLGNRSALEWVIDQYQVSTDKRSGITNDPNRPDDPTYILRLIGQVVTVSLETVKIVKTLPELAVE